MTCVILKEELLEKNVKRITPILNYLNHLHHNHVPSTQKKGTHQEAEKAIEQINLKCSQLPILPEIL